MDVFSLLRQDRELRASVTAGKNCDDCLITLGHSDAPRPKWDNSLPTIQAANPYALVAAGSLRSPAAFLDGVDADNLLLAGGACVAAVGDSAHAPGDYDLFVYGLEDELSATMRVNRLVEQLAANGWKVDRSMCTPYAITIFIRQDRVTHKVQIIRRLYPNISSVLLGFDLQACAVGWDGLRYLTTPIGHFALCTGNNIVDPTRRSTTYEARLVKYFGRGVGVILPNLITPQFECRNTAKIGQRLVARRLLPPLELDADDDQGPFTASSLEIASGVRWVSSDYDRVGDPDWIYFPDTQLVYINADNLRNGQGLLYVGSDYLDLDDRSRAAHTFDGLPALEFEHRALTPKALETIFEPLLRGFSLDRCVKLGPLAKHIPEEARRTFFLHLAENQRRLADEVLKTAVKGEIDRLVDMYTQIDHSKLAWITESPGQQGQPLHTGSIQAIWETPERWYGDQYVPTEDVLLALATRLTAAATKAGKVDKAEKVVAAMEKQYRLEVESLKDQIASAQALADIAEDNAAERSHEVAALRAELDEVYERLGSIVSAPRASAGTVSGGGGGAPDPE